MPAVRDRVEPSTPGPKEPRRTVYREDLYTWVQEQVALLRAGHVDEIDAKNIAEELSDVGNEQYDKLESALAVLLCHMLKWDHQPERRGRSWALTVAEQRRRVARVLRKNPGLKPSIPEAIEEAYADGLGWALDETGLPTEELPERCPYDWLTITGRPISWPEL